MNCENICLQTLDLCKHTGAYLRTESRRLAESAIERKGRNNYVTYVDKTAEKKLVDGLRQILPFAGFLTEEATVSFHEEEYYWVIDPLDGTSNYIHRLPPYAVSIALMRKNDILLGCVYEVSSDEAYYAWQGGGSAWMNGAPIRVSSAAGIDGAMIGHGVPYNLEPRYEYLRKRIPELYDRCTVRHMGSAATEICYVAAGKTDAYFHDNLSPWDVAAATLILRQAGGCATDLSGGNNCIFGKELVASNRLIHDELLNFLTPDQNPSYK
jgi:myo-inositol-1(or 4)-monophosphatase